MTTTPLSLTEVQELAPAARVMKYGALSRFQRLPPVR